MTRFLIALGLLLSALAHAQASDRPSGTNCKLLSPPPASGEDMNHGVVLRVYPRAKDIGPRYTGCQVLFAPSGTKWERVTLTVVQAGDPVRVWSPDEASRGSSGCRYRKGKVVAGNPDTCPAPQVLLMKSLPAGCASSIQEAMAKRGSPLPQACRPE